MADDFTPESFRSRLGNQYGVDIIITRKVLDEDSSFPYEAIVFTRKDTGEVVSFVDARIFEKASKAGAA